MSTLINDAAAAPSERTDRCATMPLGSAAPTAAGQDDDAAASHGTPNSSRTAPNITPATTALYARCSITWGEHADDVTFQHAFAGLLASLFGQADAGSGDWALTVPGSPPALQSEVEAAALAADARGAAIDAEEAAEQRRRHALAIALVYDAWGMM